MKIRCLKRKAGFAYKPGNEYQVPDEQGKALVREGCAEEVQSRVETMESPIVKTTIKRTKGKK